VLLAKYYWKNQMKESETNTGVEILEKKLIEYFTGKS
jgi:hypothetical protein